MVKSKETNQRRYLFDELRFYILARVYNRDKYEEIIRLMF